MDNPAGITDVEGSFERPLTDDETRVVPAWLRQAWSKLRSPAGVPGVELRMALPADSIGHLAKDDVVDVLVAMVERKLRNPDALRTWNGDDYGQTVDNALSSGQIYVTDEEKTTLAVPGAATSSGVYSMQLTTR